MSSSSKSERTEGWRVKVLEKGSSSQKEHSEDGVHRERCLQSDIRTALARIAASSD